MRKSLDELVEEAAELVASAERIVVFTGAGVSTESGIPDFRSPGGIWSRYDPSDFTIQKFLSGREGRRRIWRGLLESGLLTAKAEPNPAHYAVAELERMGKLVCVITQNVDGLHQKAGNSPEKVVELHGNMRWAVCLSCKRRFPLEEVVRRIEEGDEDPHCAECGGILKPDAVFFGEPLPEEALRRAEAAAFSCDLCIVMGSSLVVYPAAFIPQYARRAGAELIIINRDPTPLDPLARVRISAKVGEVMPRIVRRAKEKLGAL